MKGRNKTSREPHTVGKAGQCLRIALVLSVLLLSLGMGLAQGQGSPEGADSAQRLGVELHAETFFRNNEHDTSIGNDYTLPGYRLLTALDYTPASRHGIRLKLGASNIYYWGASLYPAGLFYSDLPYWSDEGAGYSRFRLRPFVQASMNVTRKWRLTLGSLEPDTGSEIIAPLYDPELRLTSDYKAGMEARYRGRLARLDVWVDWRSFIFRRAQHQEAFIFGLSGGHKLVSGSQHSLELRLQTIAAHRGGVENIVPDTVHTWSNLALGINYERKHRRWQLRSALYTVGYSQTGGHYRSDSGGGLYTNHSLALGAWGFNVSGWLGRDYVSVLGVPFVQTQNGGRSAYLSAGIGYRLAEGKTYTLGKAVQFWWHPYARGPISASMEVYLSIRPQWRLLSRAAGRGTR